MKIEKFLGECADTLLSAYPFNQWNVEKSFEDELDEPVIHYVFPENGLELRCDADDKISVIFVFTKKFGELNKTQFDVLLGWKQKQILAQFGEPSKSGIASKHPVLGEYGAWDRFVLKEYAVRYEYDIESEVINKITFMRDDLVPQ